MRRTTTTQQQESTTAADNDKGRRQSTHGTVRRQPTPVPGGGPQGVSSFVPPDTRPAADSSPDPDRLIMSPSRLSMMLRCGEQYRRRYVVGDKLAPGIALIVGRSLDVAANSQMLHKAETGGELLPVDEVRQVAADTFEVEYQRQGVQWTPDERALGIESARGRSKDMAVALSEAHHRAVAPHVMPMIDPATKQARVQWRVVMEADGHDFDVQCILDLVDDKGRARDLKSSKAVPADDAAFTSDQMRTQAMAVAAVDGRSAVDVALDFIVKTKRPYALTRAATLGDDDNNQLVMRRYEVAASAIKSGTFMPADPMSNMCNATWCGYHSTCPYVRKGGHKMVT